MLVATIQGAGRSPRHAESQARSHHSQTDVAGGPTILIHPGRRVYAPWGADWLRQFLLPRGITVDNSLGQPIAVCLLQVRTERETITLTGSALVREVETDAVARAVLDALNRTIGEAAH